MPRMPRFILPCAALILAASVHAASAARLPDLGTQLSLGQARVTDSRVVNVTVTVTNRTGEAQSFLRRGTPFVESFDAPMFAVERDGQPLPYLGRYVKYMAPAAADYIRLAPGESRAVTVNLGDVYDLSVAGRYRVQLRAEIRGATGPVPAGAQAGSREWSGRLGSNVAEFTIAREASRLFTPPSQRDAMSRPRSEPNSAGDTFTGCTAAEQAAVEAARDAACAMAVAAANMAGEAVFYGFADPNYEEWFGAYDPTRGATVRDNWYAIRDALCPTASFKKMEYVCHGAECGPNTFAYVYPVSEPNTIYLCNGFWNASSEGFDSRPGVLIHEMSHLKASTDDHAYGVDDCRDLADNTPATAIDNADNYEYFAEDLAMKAAVPGLGPNAVRLLLPVLVLAGAAVIHRRRRSMAA